MPVTSRTMAADSSRCCSCDFPGQSFTMTCGTGLLLCRTREILLVGDVLEPGHGRTVQRLLDIDMGHRVRRRRTVPVLLVGRTQQYVARVELEDRPSLDLRPANTVGDDQCLAKRMFVPGSAGTGFERDDPTADAGGLLALEDRVDPHIAGEPFRRTLH